MLENYFYQKHGGYYWCNRQKTSLFFPYLIMKYFIGPLKYECPLQFTPKKKRDTMSYNRFIEMRENLDNFLENKEALEIVSSDCKKFTRMKSCQRTCLIHRRQWIQERQNGGLTKFTIQAVRFQNQGKSLWLRSWWKQLGMRKAATKIS